MAFIVTIAMILLYRLQDSRIGRAWNAIREDELAAAANGINTVTTKLLAFALGATTAGLAGVFNASKLTIVSPDQFYFTVSFTVLAMVIIGGMGNIWGVAAGAFIVFMIQAVLLQQLNTITETLEHPDPVRHQLHRLPVPALRHRPRADDAVPAGGPLPEPAPAARAAHRRGDGRGLGDEPGVVGAMGEAPGAEELFEESAGEGAPGSER